MSIASEITRLQGVKSDILQAISDKGVTVPAGSALDDCPGLISSISGGGSITISDEKSEQQEGIVIVDSYGYIGKIVDNSAMVKQTAWSNKCVKISDVDFSNSGLGKVDFIKTGKAVIYGYEYNTVKLFGKEWITENVKTTFGIQKDRAQSVTTPLCCSYNNDDSNIDTMGLMFNWYATPVIDSMLDSGWRVATISDFDSLISNVNPYPGLKLSSASWGGFDNFFMSLKPGSYWVNGTFGPPYYGSWWSSDYDSSRAWNYDRSSNSDSALSKSYDPKDYMVSVILCRDIT